MKWQIYPGKFQHKTITPLLTIYFASEIFVLAELYFGGAACVIRNVVTSKNGLLIMLTLELMSVDDRPINRLMIISFAMLAVGDYFVYFRESRLLQSCC